MHARSILIVNETFSFSFFNFSSFSCSNSWGGFFLVWTDTEEVINGVEMGPEMGGLNERYLV